MSIEILLLKFDFILSRMFQEFAGLKTWRKKTPICAATEHSAVVGRTVTLLPAVSSRR